MDESTADFAVHRFEIEFADAALRTMNRYASFARRWVALIPIDFNAFHIPFIERLVHDLFRKSKYVPNYCKLTPKHCLGDDDR